MIPLGDGKMKLILGWTKLPSLPPSGMVHSVQFCPFLLDLTTIDWPACAKRHFCQFQFSFRLDGEGRVLQYTLYCILYCIL